MKGRKGEKDIAWMGVTNYILRLRMSFWMMLSEKNKNCPVSEYEGKT